PELLLGALAVARGAQRQRLRELHVGRLVSQLDRLRDLVGGVLGFPFLVQQGKAFQLERERRVPLLASGVGQAPALGNLLRIVPVGAGPVFADQRAVDRRERRL